MGIKSLNPFIREKCPQAFRDLPYSYFYGKRVAVDANNVLMKLMSRSHKEIVNQTDVCSKEPDRKAIVERWLHHLREEVIKFVRYGITLIFVFDGAYIDEKSETQKKRRDDKIKRISDAESLKTQVLELDELERTPAMVTELRKKMHHLGTITSEDKELAIDILQKMGFPVLFAVEEGEKLCAMLCIEGRVDAVYSRDTDIVAMGCPLSFSEEAGWVYNSNTQKTELSLKCTFFKPILAALEIEYPTFLDLCIMSGCDFNSNIYRLGINTAYKLLKNCKSIEALPEKYQDKIEILNHIRCREIFSRQYSKDICNFEISLNMDLNSIKQNESDPLLEDWITDLKPLYSNFPIPSDMFIEKTPSLSSSIVRLKILNKNSEPEQTDLLPTSKASPKKLTRNMISSLSAQQISNYKNKLQIKILDV